MREYLAELETVVDRMLKRWKKETRIENGKAVHLEWQFEQSHIIINVFWQENEHIYVICLNPHMTPRQRDWMGLTKKTEKQVMDLIGNFAQIVMTKYRE
jgi:hypothetical protein